MAIAYAREGADVVINYLSEEKEDADSLVKLLSEEGITIHCLPGDISTEEGAKEIVRQAEKILGHIDILVLNAAGRDNKYSDFKWHWYHFSGTDYNAANEKTAIYRILGEGKGWSQAVDDENSNYDYLMFNDLDLDHPGLTFRFFREQSKSICLPLS